MEFSRWSRLVRRDHHIEKQMLVRWRASLKSAIRGPSVSSARQVARSSSSMRFRFAGCLSIVLLLSPLRASTVEGDAIDAVQLLREGGCGGLVPAARPLHHPAALDSAAALWAGGTKLSAAVHASGYSAGNLSGVHVSGAESTLVKTLRDSECRTIADPEWLDVGVHHHGLDTWLILASGHRVAAPVAAAAPRVIEESLAMRALALVNETRARGTRCGNRAWGPAPPVTLSDTLNSVALGHAADMAKHGYFEHEDLAGRSPAARVRAVGYPESLVGENIAYGPESADEVVKGWLDSPGHCENIMDPRFAAMGIAYSSGRSAHRGLYWVQLLVAPKA